MADSVVNLSALQRVDPYIIEILQSASQVALYRFSPSTSQWDKTGVEGTLFVYKRSAPPIFGFIIMNRLSKTNQVEPITKDYEFKQEDPYLLYRNSKMGIFGIWFYDKNDCPKISDISVKLLQMEKDRYSSQQQRTRRASESESTGIVGQSKNVDILDMLSKAQEVYAKTKITHEDKSQMEPKSIASNPNALSDLVRPKAVRASSTPEDRLPLAPSAPHSEKLSVEQLFAAASRANIHASSTCPAGLNSLDIPATLHLVPVSIPHGMPSAVLTPTENALLRHLMSNPENLAEHIERQQLCESSVAPSAESLERDIKEKLKLSLTTGDVTSSVVESEPESQSAAADTSVKLHSIQNVVSCFDEILTGGSPKSPNTAAAASTNTMFTTPTKVAPQLSNMPLLSPMMFVNRTAPNPLQLLTPVVQQNGSGGSGTGGLTPNDSNKVVPESLAPLSRTQFSEALIYLIKNDTDFLSKIYSAYKMCVVQTSATSTPQKL